MAGADPVALVLVGARWLQFACLFALFGAPLFWLVAARGVPGLVRSRRATAAGLRIAAPLATLSGLAWLDASLAAMTDGFAGTLDPDFLRLFFRDTPFGGVEAMRLALLAALPAAAALPPRGLFACAPALASALLVSQAWLGHAAEGGGVTAGALGAAMIACYASHVLAGAAWLGGLPLLPLVLAEDRAGGVAALGRFSLVATIAAAVVVASGAANTLFHAGGSIAALAASGYGRVLAAKLGLVAAMLGCAAAARIALPRLRRGVTMPPSRTLALEAAAGLLVLLAAAVLGVTAPPL